MIGLSTKTFDINGDLILEELERSSDINKSNRRVTKTKTLDGSVAIEDRGYTPKDRRFTIRVEATLFLRERLLTFLQFHNALTLTTEDGAFDVSPTTFDLNRNIFILIFEAR